MSIYTGQTLTLEFTISDQDGRTYDLSSADSVAIKLKAPSGGTTSKTGTLTTDGTDGKVYYTTVTADLSEAGTWTAQAVATEGTNLYPAEAVTFTVSTAL